jgi:hypothetical protein
MAGMTRNLSLSIYLLHSPFHHSSSLSIQLQSTFLPISISSFPQEPGSAEEINQFCAVKGVKDANVRLFYCDILPMFHAMHCTALFCTAILIYLSFIFIPTYRCLQRPT